MGRNMGNGRKTWTVWMERDNIGDGEKVIGRRMGEERKQDEKRTKVSGRRGRKKDGGEGKESGKTGRLSR